MRYESERERQFWKPYRIIKTVALCMTGIAAVFVFAAVFMAKNGITDDRAAVTPAPPTLADGQMSQSDAAMEQERRANADLEEVVIDCRTVIEAVAGQTLIQNINLTNSVKNTGTYMTYELRLPDSSAQGYEVLFSTGMIAPGNTVLDVELSRPFEAGDYNCIMVAQPYEIADLSSDNNLEMNITLMVR